MISIRIYCQYSLLKSRSKLFPTKSNSLVLAPFHLKKRQTTKKKIQRKKRNLAPKLPFLFPPKKRKKEAFRSFFLSFFLSSWVPSSSFIISHHHRAGRQDQRWKSTPPRDGKAHDIEIGTIREFFFRAFQNSFSRHKERVLERTFDRFPTPPTKRMD